MNIRAYIPEFDREAAHRIWREVGWMPTGKEDWVDKFLGIGRAWVSDLDSQAECLVTTTDAHLRYLKTDIPMSIVSGVTTSRVGRKQGLAGRLAAWAIAHDAEAGFPVSALGMFEQGFYNRLGYGTLNYRHTARLDPATLSVPQDPRIPIRLEAGDWQELHALRLRRMRGHGSVNITAPEFSGFEMQTFGGDVFGLGYRNEDGELTHYLWGFCKEPELGPYTIHWMAYQSYDQMLELLGLVRNLGDQVRMVMLHEPPNVQIQDLLIQPFRFRQLSEKGEYAGGLKATAVYQMRICDLKACVAQMRSVSGEVRFNLSLSDPIERYLPVGHEGWKGVAGDYILTIGTCSGAEVGTDETLPTLKASVGSFTRLWFGARPATSLAVTDDLRGPQSLLDALDEALLMPTPYLDWDF